MSKPHDEIKKSLDKVLPRQASIILTDGALDKLARSIAAVWELDDALAMTVEDSVVELLEAIDRS